jgi:CheY-like chemotaxis protein
VTILVVEDDENKRNQLQQYLRAEFPGVALRSARSFRSALDQVVKGQPDIMLLDMTLPTFDQSPQEPGGHTRRFGGRDVLREIDRKHIALPVIVVTQFEQFEGRTGVIDLDDLDRELRAAHRPNYRGAVYYHPSSSAWRERLTALMVAAIRELEIS